MILDSNLNWQHHILELNKKLFRGVGMIYKLKNLSEASVLKSIYFSLFQSHATYGLVAWGSSHKCLEKSFKITGVDIFNEINNLPFYESSRTRQTFLKHYKNFLIDQYQVIFLFLSHFSSFSQSPALFITNNPLVTPSSCSSSSFII